MRAGISTASFYNMNLEDAFLSVGKCGSKVAEIFVNSHCELHGEVLETMLKTQKEYGIDVVTIHPFACSFETMMMYTDYERRFSDFLEYYKNFFEYANKFGAKFIVMHGNKPMNNMPWEFVADRFGRLQDEANKFGVSIAQENVVRNTSKDLKYLQFMVKHLGDRAKFVLDTKQARRTGISPIEFVKTLGDKIVHIHYSDCGKDGDCLIFGKGDFDNHSFFNELSNVNYKGDAVIEVYRDAYSSILELKESYIKFDNFLKTNKL